MVATSFALDSVPFVVALATGGYWLIAVLVMLSQSYRPGRMTFKHWAAFAVVLTLSVALPSPLELVAHPFKMPTGSMSPTLQGKPGKGDHVFVDRLTYRFSSPRRGDLLVFVTKGIPGLPQDQIYVNRIVGMPEEQIEVHDGSIFANGARLTEREGVPPIRFTPGDFEGQGESGSSGSRASCQVSQAGYFVVGDNSTNNLDSRHWGCVPRQNVYGKITAIYYPFSRAGRPRFPGESGGRTHPITGFVTAF